MDEGRPGYNSPDDDIAPELVQAARRRARINALVLVAVIVLGTLLPPSKRVFAPLLFAVPFILTIVERIRKFREGAPGSGMDRASPEGSRGVARPVDPYSSIPKDPKDPRRYKPIG